MSETNISRYRAEDLEAWVADAFAAVGTTPADAKETARVLVRTNLRGIDTHGVARVPGYVEKIRSGEVNPAPTPSSSIRDGILFFDGGGGLGQGVAGTAVRSAVKQARHASVVPCTIRGSGHLAARGPLALEAAAGGRHAYL